MDKIRTTLLLSAALLAANVRAQNWSTAGNAGTSPGSNSVSQAVDGSFVGTTDNSSLVLGTGWAKRAVLDLQSNMWGGSYTAPMPAGVGNCFAWGIGNAFVSPANNSAAFGYQNSLNAAACFATGQGNILGPAANYASVSGYGNANNASTGFAAGQYNSLGQTAGAGAVFGLGNHNDASLGFVTGQWNTLSATATGAVSFGYFNQNDAPRGLITGQQNTLAATAVNSVAMGTYNGASGSNSFALGWANFAAGNSSMAIGASATTTADNQFAANFAGGYSMMGGRVGIGTASPQAKLEIASGTANNSGLKLTNLTSASPAATVPTATLGVDAGGNVVTVAGGSTTAANNYMPSYRGSVSAAAMTNTFNLPVNPAYQPDGTATLNMITGDPAGGGGFGMLDAPFIASPTVWLYANQHNAFTVAIMNSSTRDANNVGHPELVGDNLVPVLQVRETGNVLIGKTTQSNLSYRLDVAGPIRADKVTVNMGGADFVFDPSFKLRPLAEVETYVKNNKHLPGVAPAAEMQKDGVEVGEYQTRLLQKVEELTLYMIEMKKESERQQQEIEGLKNQLSKQTK